MATVALMNRHEKVMLYVLGICQILKRDGFITAGFDLSEEGYNVFLELKSSGFRPTADEIQAAMFHLQTRAAEMVQST